jgi:hypothetical protein
MNSELVYSMRTVENNIGTRIDTMAYLHVFSSCRTGGEWRRSCGFESYFVFILSLTKIWGVRIATHHSLSDISNRFIFGLFWLRL